MIFFFIHSTKSTSFKKKLFLFFYRNISIFRDVMAKLDLNEWRGVLIVSGDGLVHEAYNGLFVG